MYCKIRRVLLGSGIVWCGAAICLADTLNPIPRPQSGKIVEDCTQISQVSISLTDMSGAEIGAGTITVPCNIPNSSNGFRTAIINIPAVVQTSSGPVNVADFRQTTTAIQHSGEIADLSVEAVYFDQTTGKFVIGSVFGTLANAVGEAAIPIPDLFADTNSDGSLDTGDILYSVVDLNLYLTSVPVFNLGDTFQIVNGKVTGLPGMTFSTTPLVFNADTGQFGGTLYTGTGFADARHNPSAVPEPASGSLAALVLLAGGVNRLASTRRYRG